MNLFFGNYGESKTIIMIKTLPIWRDAQRQLLNIESSMLFWPRYHKYTLGSEMRVQASQYVD